MSHSEIRILSLTAISPSPLNIRKIVDDSAIDDLAESIRAVGLLQAIIVRPAAKEGRYEIVCGARRHAACQKAGIEEVPAIVRNDLTDDADVIEVMVVENDQRESVNPMEEALGLHALVETGRYGFGSEAKQNLAAKLGRSERYVGQRLNLMNLCEEVADRLLAGKVSFSVALELSKYGESFQQKYVDDEYVTVKQIRDDARCNLHVLGKATFDTQCGVLAGIGSCDGCPKRSDAMQGLFPEMREVEEPRCLDSECWQKKSEAGAQVRKQALLDQGRDVREANIGENSYSYREDELCANDGVIIWMVGRNAGMVRYKPKPVKVGGKDFDPVSAKASWEQKVRAKFRESLVDATMLARKCEPIEELIILARMIPWEWKAEIAKRRKIKAEDLVLEPGEILDVIRARFYDRLAGGYDKLNGKSLGELAVDAGIDVDHLMAEAELEVKKPKKLLQWEKEQEEAKAVKATVSKRKRKGPGAVSFEKAEAGS